MTVRTLSKMMLLTFFEAKKIRFHKGRRRKDLDLSLNIRLRLRGAKISAPVDEALASLPSRTKPTPSNPPTSKGSLELDFFSAGSPKGCEGESCNEDLGILRSLLPLLLVSRKEKEVKEKVETRRGDRAISAFGDQNRGGGEAADIASSSSAPLANSARNALDGWGFGKRRASGVQVVSLARKND